MDLEETVGGCALDSSGSGQGSVADSCEHGNEPSGSIKGKEFLDQQSVLLAPQEGKSSIKFVACVPALQFRFGCFCF
jgi:hypothetical protein